MNNRLGWTEHTHLVQNILSDIETLTLRAESGQRSYAFSGDARQLKEYQNIAQVHELLDRLAYQISDNPPQIDRTASLRDRIQERQRFMDQCIALKKAGKIPEMMRLLESGEGLQLSRAVHNKITEMYAVEASLLEQRRRSVGQFLGALTTVLVLGLILEVLLGYIVLSLLARRMRPLAASVRLADRIGSNDLTVEPADVRIQDEVGRVNLILNKILTELKGMSEQNKGYAARIEQVLEVLIASSHEQSVALQQQSTAIQQTSVTMEELSQSARQIADLSKSVASRADETAQAAKLGYHSVQTSAQSTTDLVRQVQEVSKRIHSLGEKADSIHLVALAVNEIAERSSVLALNASILAASDDLDKMGFGLVASEMKSLAEQCKDSTVQVRTLITEISRGILSAVTLMDEASRRAQSGLTYTDNASVSIQQLAAQVHGGSEAFSQIVAATSQQRLAFEQVEEALISIRDSSKQTAQTGDELKETIRELKALSGRLQETEQKRPGISRN